MSYIGTQPIGGSVVSEFFSGDGSTTTFTLTYTYGTEASVLVFIDGVKQATSTYAVINGQIEFTTAPPSGSNNIELIYVGGRVLTNPYLSADTYGVIRVNPSILTTNTTITTGYNGSAAGPITVANNVTLEISNNSTFTVF
jgi:hypothetical protein